MKDGSASTAPVTTWKRPESILVVVASDTGRFLAMERVAPTGFWQSVTGSLEPDERPAEAAQRELAEETGIEARPVELGYYTDFTISAAWRHRYAPDVTTNREHVFALTLANEIEVRLNPAEHRDYRWLDYSSALQQLSSSTNRAAVDRYRSLRGRGGGTPRHG